MPRIDWSREENEAAVASYFEMLEASLRGEQINKAEYNRRLRAQLNVRTHGAVEYKYQNISAVLIDLGVPYMTGYKPAVNYQRDLRSVVVEQLSARRVLRQVISASVNIVPLAPVPTNPGGIFAPVPDPRVRSARPPRLSGVRSPVDYVALEARNVTLGLAGEKFVVELERSRLETAGQSRLAAQVCHVSVERGDGLGFDILSFEEDSRERLIEVKTTKYGEYTPFYLSQNELEASKLNLAQYNLYRVYSFGVRARVFVRSGALDVNFALENATYMARVN